jgi:hypothetical protein
MIARHHSNSQSIKRQSKQLVHCALWSKLRCMQRMIQFMMSSMNTNIGGAGASFVAATGGRH